ncbi:MULTISPECIES: ATP-grasp domain-containing protein [Desulfosediminicola]|uniref:ATP-grasp domain-containing protein n=1 Tax=Desulfosediminicola TaxID=2886823 RepID=UPI0010ACE0C0|nr:hypothetical protein [Desulfosediminicola ganghwensis]
MTDQSVRVIDNNEFLFQNYQSLTSWHIVNCRLRLIPGEEHLLIDLLKRGITLIPSASAQITSRSKVHQARIYSDFMLPNTVAVYDANSLLEATSLFTSHSVTEVVLKRDRKNSGIGIHRFSNIEDVYNLATFCDIEFPFVIQPLARGFRDIRVILLGEYTEAYERINNGNFRRNLHCGGSAAPVEITDEIRGFCRDVMERGDFPYAHIDLMLFDEELNGKTIYLTEINLRGGLRGARISTPDYQSLTRSVHDRLVREYLNS